MPNQPTTMTEKFPTHGLESSNNPEKAHWIGTAGSFSPPSIQSFLLGIIELTSLRLAVIPPRP